MRVNLTLQHLEAFMAIATTGSFRAAAETLHVSQPALSRTIRVAEETLRARLFDRDTRHVDLTAAGKELLPIARRILGEFDDSLSELSQFLAGRRGHVTLAALPSVSVAMIPGALATFRDQYPDVSFSLNELPRAPLLKAVEEGVVDFGISVQPTPDQQFRYIHLLDDPFVLVCRRGDALASQESASWSVFASHAFIASAERSSIRPLTDAAFLQRHIRVTPRFTSPSVPAAGAMVAAGLGITTLPRLALHLIDTRELAIIPLHRPLVSRAVGVITRSGRSLSPMTQRFIDAIVAFKSAPSVV